MAIPLGLEHLPADVLPLSQLARTALSQGGAFRFLPLARAVRDIPLPAERHGELERGELARALQAGLAPLEPPTRVLSSLKALEREGNFAVIAGQQPGLLASPLYTLYKALQACKLAHSLSLVWGRPVVPLFWNHGDDHDVAEVHHAYLLNRNLDLQRIGLAAMSSGRLPLSRLVLEEERHRLGAIRSALAQSVEGEPCVEEALELFAPRAGETLVRGLTRALTSLCGEHGLVVVEPDWVRPALSRALARVVASDPLASLEETADSLRAAGLPVAIEPREAALVFRVDESGRRPLRSGGEGFRYDEEPGSRTAAELGAEIQQSPAQWSAGALLRPLVQDLALPTAATIGGWAELAYHSELGGLRQRVGLPALPFVARVSCTLLDPESRLALGRLGLTARAVLERRGQLETEEEAVPRAILDVRASTEEAVALLARHQDELAGLDPAFRPNLQRSLLQFRGMIEKLLEKAVRVHQNKSGKGARHLRRLANMLYPRGEPQERVLGPFAFTARYGRDWIEALYAELPACSSEHLLVRLGADAPATGTP